MLILLLHLLLSKSVDFVVSFVVVTWTDDNKFYLFVVVVIKDLKKNSIFHRIPLLNKLWLCDQTDTKEMNTEDIMPYLLSVYLDVL